MKIYPAPTYSPWGSIQNKTKLADGVYTVSTAGHGGIMVHRDAAQISLTIAAQSEAEAYRSGLERWLCFEEDCKASIAFYDVPAWFRANLTKRLNDWKSYLDGTIHVIWSPPAELFAKAPKRIAELEAKLALSDADLIRQDLLQTVSIWDAQYLLARNIEPDPVGYARYLESRRNDQMRAEKNGAYIFNFLAACC